MADVLAETTNKTTEFIMAGLAVTIGLAWNEAIKSGIDEHFPITANGGGVRMKFIYAIALTAILVVITFTLLKVGIKQDNKKEPCVCADNEEMKRVSLKLNDKIDKVIYQRGLDTLNSSP